MEIGCSRAPVYTTVRNFTEALKCGDKNIIWCPGRMSARDELMMKFLFFDWLTYGERERERCIVIHKL